MIVFIKKGRRINKDSLDFSKIVRNNQSMRDNTIK